MKRLWPLFIILVIGCNVFRPITNKLLTKEERHELREKERCNRKLARIIKKCPGLLDSTEATVEVVTVIDSQEIAKSFKQNQDVSGVDSIIQRYKGLIDSAGVVNDSLINILLTDIGSDVKRYIIERPCLSKPIIIDTSITIMIDEQPYSLKITFGAKSTENNQQEVFLKVPQTEFKTEAVTKVPVIKETELTWKEKAFNYLNSLGWQIWWWIVLAGIILVIVRFGKVILRYFRLIK
jgi:hypothetical protein